jgi:hypothetical protein
MTTQLIPVYTSPALRNAIALWADATTAPATARRADAGDLVGLRDYAMLLFYALTGMRRA